MEKRFIAASLFLSLSSAAMAASTATSPVTNSGFAFPATVTISAGDTISFTLGSGHNATEVSKATYDANGTTASGGFLVTDGASAKVAGLTVGTHYYVCTHHVGSFMMKGQIIVQTPNGVKPSLKELTGFTFQIEGLNPISMVMIGQTAKLSIMDIKGRSVWSILVNKNDFENLSWDRKSAAGEKVSAGAYFVQLTSLDAQQKPLSNLSRTLVQLR